MKAEGRWDELASISKYKVGRLGRRLSVHGDERRRRAGGAERIEWGGRAGRGQDEKTRRQCGSWRNNLETTGRKNEI